MSHPIPDPPRDVWGRLVLALGGGGLLMLLLCCGFASSGLGRCGESCAQQARAGERAVLRPVEAVARAVEADDTDLLRAALTPQARARMDEVALRELLDALRPSLAGAELRLVRVVQAPGDPLRRHALLQALDPHSQTARGLVTASLRRPSPTARDDQGAPLYLVDELRLGDQLGDPRLRAEAEETVSLLLRTLAARADATALGLFDAEFARQTDPAAFSAFVDGQGELLRGGLRPVVRQWRQERDQAELTAALLDPDTEAARGELVCTLRRQQGRWLITQLQTRRPLETHPQEAP
jgi:hypothetical protein